MKVVCVIPARYASSRLPGKPLALIGNKPMIQWVYEAALNAENIDKVLVATDHRDIFNMVQQFGGNAVMTPPELPSGTDRVYEAIKNETVDVVINLQGDEPFISGDLISDLVNVFKEDSVSIATAVCSLTGIQELNDPNIVKVVRDGQGYALYFSRSAIPYFRDADNKNVLESHLYFKHIGIYAYRKNCLAKLTELKESLLEKAERLEQLRFLENGYKIFTIITDYKSVSVDTAEDLKRVNNMLQQKV